MSLIAYGREHDERGMSAEIRAYYARLDAERIAHYELRHGPGSAARHHAELLAAPLPDELCVADAYSIQDRANGRGGA
jgi:hypothetical protein